MDIIGDEIIGEQHNVYETGQSAMSECAEDNDNTGSDREENNENLSEENNQSENNKENENPPEHDNNEYGFDDEITYDNHQERGAPLYESCSLTLEESELLIMNFIIRHNITDVGLEDLLSLINCHLPTIVHKSKYLFLNKFPKTANIVTHFYCINCFTLFDFVGKNINTKCPDCRKKYNQKVLQHDGNFFIQLPLKEQLSNVVSSYYNKFQRMTLITYQIFVVEVCTNHYSVKIKFPISILHFNGIRMG
ncbi:uncharacterized protein LOC120356967 isoform X2 [Solenopsis invicta]|uniref:uncharacterized protein LOC120356967 isoform X2 n=1 Tax=Solenopsis invicta TaxID=13686 RepID=UPI00193E8C9F|nr:uncharacterized protein LOC120356967 isoform X2 [Solenopsis invicta]